MTEKTGGAVARTHVKGAKEATISAVVIRADGSVHDLGKIAGKRSISEKIKARAAHRQYIKAIEKE